MLVNQVNQYVNQKITRITHSISSYFFFPTHARGNEEMKICVRAYGFQNVLVQHSAPKKKKKSSAREGE